MAVARTLNRNPEELIKEIGHDGSEIAWPDLQDPQRRKGFSHQDIIHWGLRHNVAVVMVLPHITRLSVPVAQPIIESVDLKNFWDYDGVLMCAMKDKRRHAISKIGTKLYDGDSVISEDEILRVDCFLILIRLPG